MVTLVIFMYAIWSTVFCVGKLTLEYCPPRFLTGARMVLAGLLILGFFALFKPSSFKKLHRIHFFPILLLAFLSVYLTNVLEFWGLKYLSATKTCFIYSLSPFFAALLSYLHFDEKMNGRKWLGLCIGFLGFIPVLWTSTG